MKVVLDLIIAGLVLGLTYGLTSEGLWGAALMFFNVLFGAMIALNFYEPLAKLLDSTGIPWGFSDTLCLLGLFCVSVVILRMTTETLAPAQVRFPTPVYHAGRLIFGLGGAAITLAVVILAFHCAPVHKKIFDAVVYDTKPPFGLGLDHQFLGLFQRETGGPFAQYGSGQRDPHGEYGNKNRLNLFDPKGEWLINHQNARPYGTDTVPPAEEAAAGGGGAAGGGAAGGGQAGPGGPPAGPPLSASHQETEWPRAKPSLVSTSARPRRSSHSRSGVRFFRLGVALKLQKLESRLSRRPGRD